MAFMLGCRNIFAETGKLDRSCDQIDEKRTFVFVVNPNPDSNWIKDSVKNGAVEIKGDFALSYGFSDQVFLVRCKDLARPIYKEKCLASLRYPLSHIGSIFEMRVDAYMRTHRRLRATYVPATYINPDNEGLSYPPELSWIERIRKIRNVISPSQTTQQICSENFEIYWPG